MTKPFFQIETRLVGEDYPPLVIPEIGINHNGSSVSYTHLRANETGRNVV